MLTYLASSETLRFSKCNTPTPSRRPVSGTTLLPNTSSEQLRPEITGRRGPEWTLAGSSFGSAVFLNKFFALAAMLTLWQSLALFQCLSSCERPPRPANRCYYLSFFLPASVPSVHCRKIRNWISTKEKSYRFP